MAMEVRCCVLVVTVGSYIYQVSTYSCWCPVPVYYVRSLPWGRPVQKNFIGDARCSTTLRIVKWRAKQGLQDGTGGQSIARIKRLVQSAVRSLRSESRALLTNEFSVCFYRRLILIFLYRITFLAWTLRLAFPPCAGTLYRAAMARSHGRCPI